MSIVNQLLVGISFASKNAPNANTKDISNECFILSL
jgi:hypothetical protein